MNQTKKNGNWKRKMEPYAFLVPLVLILFLFLVIPLVKAAIMSFQYYYVTKPSPNGHYFVGLENYGKVLQDEYFFNSVKVTLIYIVVTVAGSILSVYYSIVIKYKVFGTWSGTGADHHSVGCSGSCSMSGMDLDV